MRRSGQEKNFMMFYLTNEISSVFRKSVNKLIIWSIALFSPGNPRLRYKKYAPGKTTGVGEY